MWGLTGLEALPIATVPPARGAKLRVLPQPIYDSEVTGTAAISQVNFFSTALGGAFANLSTSKKGLSDTNMRQVGQLGSPLEFDMIGFNLKVFPASPVTTAVSITADDFYTFYSNAYLEFLFNNRPFLQVPLWEIPNGCGPNGSGTTVADTNNNLINGVPHRSNVFKYLVGKYRVRIRATENFSANIKWDGISSSATTAVSLKATLFLQGFLFNAI